MSNTQADCTGKTREYTNKQTENTKTRQPAEEAGVNSARDGGAWEHAPSLVPPSQRSTTINHSPTAHGQKKKAERGYHVSQRTKSSLARADHAPDSDDRHERRFRRRERTTMGNSAEGRVSGEKQWSCVDLAPKRR